MSSGQEEESSTKSDDDTGLKSPIRPDKSPSKDQVDHILQSIGHQGLTTDDGSNKTDSGFKDNVPSELGDKTKSNSDNTDENSDDDLELKWDDDETDEQDATTLEKEPSSHDSEAGKVVGGDNDDTNLSKNVNDEIIAELDENKLLESPTSNNEDTNLSSTFDIVQIDSQLNKEDTTKPTVGNIQEIDENLLLEGPECDIVDEEKLLETVDGIKEVSNDTKSIKTDINIAIEKPCSSNKSEDLSPENECNALKSCDITAKDSQNIEQIISTPTKTSNNEDTTKIINNLETDPILDKSQTFISTSSPNESLDTTVDINTDHGLVKPDVMLEIPTQEIIELMDDTDLLLDTSDDKMEVEDASASSKALDDRKMEENLLVEDNDDIIVKPSDVLRLDTLNKDTEQKNEAHKNVDVSEDDWSEIERRLEGFEHSLCDDSEQKESEVQLETKLVEKLVDTDKTKSLPLTDAQKLVIQTENKELLRTLQDTSIVESTEEQISNAMDIDEENSTSNGKQPEKSPSNVDTKQKKYSHLKDKIKEVTITEIKSDVTCNTENESNKTDNAVTETKSPTNISKSEVEADTKKDEVLTSTANTKVDEQATKVTIKVDDSMIKKTPTKNVENIKLTDPATTKNSNVDGPLSTNQLTKVQSPLKQSIDTDNGSETPISTVEINDNYSTTKIIDEILNQPKEILNKVVESSNAKTINNKKETKNKVQLSTLTVDVEPSTTNEVKTSKLEIQDTTSKSLDTDKESKQDEAPKLPTTSKLTTVQSAEVVPSTSKEVIPSTSTNEIVASTSTDVVVPSTSKEVIPSTSKDDVQPSTSTQANQRIIDPESADEVPESLDSLGLLAESSRVMEDDEEPDDDDDNEADADDDEDYDPEDESSNQMTAEHSEDSNAPHSETDQPKDQKETETESPSEEKGEATFIFTSDVTGKGVEGEKEVDVDEVTLQDDIEVTPEQVGNEATNDVQATEIDEKATDDKEITEKTVEIAEVPERIEKDTESKLMKLLMQDNDKGKKETKDDITVKLCFGVSDLMSVVDLEGSSDDDTQEKKKDTSNDSDESSSIKRPGTVDVMAVSDQPGVKETTDSEKGTTKVDNKAAEKTKPKLSLEIFSLDSDEEQTPSTPAQDQQKSAEPDPPRESNKCINSFCASTGKIKYYRADAASIAYFNAEKRKKALVCEACSDIVGWRAESLINGIKELTPLLELDTRKTALDLVEISDSESEDEGDTPEVPSEVIGETGASFLETNLAKMINETWTKFCLDSRLNEAQDELNKEMEKLEAESKEIDTLLNECQVATDKLRYDLYATFEQKKKEIDAITVYDTPITKYTCMESGQKLSDFGTPEPSTPETRAKRRMSSAIDLPAKRPAIPLGYAPLDDSTQDIKPTVETNKAEDDKDISVLKVSAELAPSDLPPPGELVRPPLRAGLAVFAMRNVFGCWLRSRILEINGKSSVPGMTQSFTVCRVKYEHKTKASTKLAPARCLAYYEPANVRLTIGTRIIALFKDSQNPLKKDAFYSGIISEVPNPVNNYRYLVFFDDGYAQYVHHRDTRVVCECSSLVWEEVHPFSREFVKEYLMAYPERPMVRLHAGQSLKTEWNGKWWVSRVIQVDASLVQVHFEEDNRTEWIYRGSTRLAPLFLELQAAERHRARPMPRTKAQPRINMPYVEYTRSDEQNKNNTEQPLAAPPPPSDREIRQRAVAKKSTALPPAPASIQPPTHESVTSRVVYYTPKNAVKPYKMTLHTCGPLCKRKDVLALKDLRTYNPLSKPLLSGWERQIVRFKGHKEVMYRAPCGRRLRSMPELHRYLRLIQSDMAVDLFDFTPHTHCLAEFVQNKCLIGKKDLSNGKENVPIPCVNFYDDSLPEFCSYNTERTPTAGVPLNLDPEFLCGCDCTDDCEDKSKCACWQMTLEGARTIGLDGPNVGYKYKRLPEPLPSGIYECNSRCKCKHTCLNRVAQHSMQLKLQVFKTLNRGWGIRALNDVPKGSFLCVYAGNLLTDATANMDGLNEGDEYLAELDYIEVVEQMKEGYEEDIPEADKRLDKKNIAKVSEESEMSSSEEEDETPSKDEKEDGDFCPGFITGVAPTEFSKRLRKRDKIKKKGEEDTVAKEKDKDGEKRDEDTITISDDEEVREPSSFMAQAGMGKEFISKYRSVRSYFGKDEACYIMDAKVQGNIGRYLNHSCQPNVFVQNVFVDTHDPRFPWVAFFALSHIKAGTELTWNYNYDVGSVPGKVLYCYCGAPNCRGRLL